MASLLRINPSTRKAEVLLDDCFWSMLYPTSIIIDKSGDIFIGMRHGVAKTRKVDGRHKIDWLVPSEEFEKEIERQAEAGLLCGNSIVETSYPRGIE